MALNDDQKRLLQTNLARDKAEQLLAELKRTAEEASQQDRPDLTPQQRLMGEMALKNAMASAQRMVDNLNAAMRLAEQMCQEGQDDQDAGGLSGDDPRDRPPSD